MNEIQGDLEYILQERKIKAEKRKSGHEKTTLPQRQCRLEESDYDGSVALCQGIEFRVGQFRLEIHKGPSVVFHQGHLQRTS